MYRGWLILTALLIAIYCLLYFFRQVAVCKKNEYGSPLPVLSLIFLVKNQQEIIEGIIRKVFAGPGFQSGAPNSRLVEVIVVDIGSADQTRPVLERLVRGFPGLRVIFTGAEQGNFRKMHHLCRGQIIYSFDLTGPINFGLMSRTIDSILDGTRTSLYRTRVLYKNETTGRCTSSKNVVK